MLQKGVLRTVYKSRRIKEYRLWDREKIKRAIEMVVPQETGEKPEKPPEDLFEVIAGFDDFKKLLRKIIEKHARVHILMVGPPSSAKTLFLLEIARVPMARYVLGGSASKAGLAEILAAERPKYLLIDELDKMNPEDLSILLSLCETGKVIETKYRKTREINLDMIVFAAASTSRTPVKTKEKT